MPESPRSGDVYRVDAARTDILILVYRDGPLANLGHNHVISARGVTGSVFVQPRLTESTFELSLPVAELLIDDPAARAGAGEEFSSLPSANDIAGTRENMLGSQLLDFPRYGTISVKGRLASAGTSPEVAAMVRVKERAARKLVPVVLSIQDDLLTISGTLELTHEELGLEPFSVMMGAIRVAEVLTLRFRISATRAFERES